MNKNVNELNYSITTCIKKVNGDLLIFMLSESVCAECIIELFFCVFFQTPAHDRCAPARSHPPEPAGDQAAEPSDLLQRCSGCPGAAAAAGFPL